jgi:DNA-binding CsgD family transcriptional regulator
MSLSVLRSDSDPVFSRREFDVVAFVGEAISARLERVLRLRSRLRQQLTARQSTTLDHLLRGYSEREIAQLLKISDATAHEHIGAVYRKFGVHTRSELMAGYIKRSMRAGVASQ